MATNVLLLTIDSLRLDEWRSLQTSLEAGRALAAAGVSFDRAFTTGPGTTSSFPGMLTGTLPLSHGGLGPLSPSRPRVSSELKACGLHTAGFHSNPFLSTHFNYEEGFDTFRDYQNPLMGVATRIFPRGIEINQPAIKRIDNVVNLTGAIKSSYQRLSGKARPYVSAEVIADDTIEWISGESGPFFCWAHFMDVHHPCYPPREDRELWDVADIDETVAASRYSRMINDPDGISPDEHREMMGLYRAAIHYVDRQIQRILDALSDGGVLSDTLIILTSDHGELFGEYDRYGKPARMYNELLHVPLIVVNADARLASVRTELISLLDLPPLIHHALDAEVPKAYEGILPGQRTREYIVAEHAVDGKPIVGVRSNRWCYEIDEIREKRRLIDLEMGTARDGEYLPDAEAELVCDVALQRMHEIGHTTHETTRTPLDRDVEARLETLGYR